MKIKNIRIHNRPAYNSEVHATRDMGVGELNNCYEDAELADTIVAVGTNALETQTNYFLNHWVPNLRGTSAAKKEAELPGEPHPPARVVIVDPRRTVTVNACEVEAGKDNVLHLAINSGTDLALFNAWLTYIAEQGWVDKEFLAASTTGFDEAVAANKTTLEQAAEITGLTVDQIKQAAHWIAEPKDGKRRRTMFAYEKGLIWGNDNYRTNGALVNVALATGNIGRPGGGCVRMGGHQEGYSRPSDGFIRPAGALRRQAADRGQGRRPPHLGLRPLQDHAQRDGVQARLQEAHRPGEGRDELGPGRRPAGHGRGDHGRDQGRRPVRGRRRHRAEPDRRGLPRLAAGRDLGRDEPDLDERRAPDAPDRALHGPARPGHARLPDRRPHRQPHGDRRSAPWATTSSPTSSRASTGRPRRTRSWTATTPTRRAGSSSPTSGCGPWAPTASRSRPPAFDGRQDRRHQAALCRRQVRQGRQGQVHGHAMARPGGARQAGAEGQVRLPDQQRPRQRGLAEHLSRPAERVRHGPLALSRTCRSIPTTWPSSASTAGDLVEV